MEAELCELKALLSSSLLLSFLLLPPHLFISPCLKLTPEKEMIILHISGFLCQHISLQRRMRAQLLQLVMNYLLYLKTNGCVLWFSPKSTPCIIPDYISKSLLLSTYYVVRKANMVEGHDLRITWSLDKYFVPL